VATNRKADNETLGTAIVASILSTDWPPQQAAVHAAQCSSIEPTLVAAVVRAIMSAEYASQRAAFFATFIHTE
jgi:hypothetical protein